MRIERTRGRAEQNIHDEVGDMESLEERTDDSRDQKDCAHQRYEDAHFRIHLEGRRYTRILSSPRAPAAAGTRVEPSLRSLLRPLSRLAGGNAFVFYLLGRINCTAAAGSSVRNVNDSVRYNSICLAS